MKSQKAKIGQYPALNVMFSITVSLFLGGLFALLSWFVHHVTNRFQNQTEVKVFLQTGLSNSGAKEIELSIGKMAGDAFQLQSITFMSKEEAAKALVAETGEDFVKLLGDNPLRDYYSVRYQGTVPKAQMDDLVQKIESVTGVYEVFHQNNILHQMKKNMANLSIAIFIGMALFLSGVFLLINQAIRIALYSQRFLIRTMLLVGATHAFIKRPYLQRALQQGIICGVLAMVALIAVKYMLQFLIPDLMLFENYYFYTLLALSLLLGGGALSFLSASMALNKYLKTNIDQLYK